MLSLTLHHGWFSGKELIRVVLGVLEGVATVHHPAQVPGGEGQGSHSQSGHLSPASEEGHGAGVVGLAAASWGEPHSFWGGSPGDANIDSRVPSWLIRLTGPPAVLSHPQAARGIRRCTTLASKGWSQVEIVRRTVYSNVLMVKHKQYLGSSC